MIYIKICSKKISKKKKIIMIFKEKIRDIKAKGQRQINTQPRVSHLVHKNMCPHNIASLIDSLSSD